MWRTWSHSQNSRSAFYTFPFLPSSSQGTWKTGQLTLLSWDSISHLCFRESCRYNSSNGMASRQYQQCHTIPWPHNRSSSFQSDLFGILSTTPCFSSSPLRSIGGMDSSRFSSLGRGMRTWLQLLPFLAHPASLQASGLTNTCTSRMGTEVSAKGRAS